MPDTPNTKTISPNLFALYDKTGALKTTKATKDMIILLAGIGDKIASYQLTKIESVGLADEEPKS